MAKREEPPDRRSFCLALGASMASLGVVACAAAKGSTSPGGEGAEEGHGAEVTPGEDLMQEHGVLERVLLVYEEVAARLETAKPFDPTLLVTSADIVHRFVAEYHEKLEETFVFPRLERAGKEVQLVATLKDQHQKGRTLTDEIRSSAAAAAGDGARLAGLLRSYVRMYRPHAAREETVLFPAFRKTLDRDGYHELGEQFEDREHSLFGEGGFEEMVAQVSKVEVALDIHDLARFSPR
jgi:hemerythrin-like domain-containing protein